MQLTPNQALEHIKESAIEYLETAYRIAHPLVYAERGQMLRERGTVAQDPFIEATPAFPTTRKLDEMEREHPEIVPNGLTQLVQHGLPVDRFKLYTHQDEAILKAFSDHPNLLVATGTGSGKTEAFVLPILASILREAYMWSSTKRNAERGIFQNDTWLHARRHETRPAALRAIILYPMNALVNDQLSRLRRILARGNSPDWQQRNLKGNVIHFGMYTSLAQPTGLWKEKTKRDRFSEYFKGLEEDWQKLPANLRETGFWPRPDSPEMLCRWDMQAAPPDILVTNYSMLEYMLVRPIEAPIFEKTAAWLANSPDARLTLVLDEAHTYTGARGTEVAHLVRRLKERLGLQEGSSKFCAIATSASIPTGADTQILQFTSDLFGEPKERFSLIRLGTAQKKVKHRNPTERALKAFDRFYASFELQEPQKAIEALAADLELGNVDKTLDSQIALHRILDENEEVTWVRERTARNATLLSKVAEECWGDLGTPQEREQATAGVLAAGSYARAAALQDTPPLLSMRVHAFYRGVPGLWACMNPDCPELDPKFKDPKNPRPIGKLYSEPRPWCGAACGARLLELFSCRHCGLLFLGGIPDTSGESLWPWSDDLAGEKMDLRSFRVFGVERPHSEAKPEYRSIRTTRHTHPNDPFARPVYEVEGAEDQDGQEVSPFPSQCPRCQNYRAPGEEGREVIEPLRTRGPRTFSIICEDGFRVQSRSATGRAPNFGRKALIFTDARNEAAQLAADLRRDHAIDLFRQLVYRALYACPHCNGTGSIEETAVYVIGEDPSVTLTPCPVCQGTGRTSNPQPIKYADLKSRVIQQELDLGINPTNGWVEFFFTELKIDQAGAMAKAEQAFNAALRRELSEVEFALEPLGLAKWRVILPNAQGQLAPFSQEETQVFLQCVTRVLATEKILLAPEPHKPWEWPDDLVKRHERNRLFWGYKREGDGIPYNLTPKRKLGRYVRAISRALVAEGRLANYAVADQWLKDLQNPLWKTLQGLRILQWAGAKVGDQASLGIRVDSFELQTIGIQVHRCKSCAYVMGDTLLNVCLRCGQGTELVPTSALKSYYRRAAFHALPESDFDDPYPLRAIEHTAQISGGEARNLERWFQDLFHDDQEPLDHRVDVLSVTTTMEMGIDIGSLLSVGLRNVPPNVANYQQRAGRAGRRGSALATVLTFSQFRSHDQYYFHHPPEIVSDPPRVPSLYMQNEIIARRHVRSLLLQSFFYQAMGGQLAQGLFGSWGTVATFSNKQQADRLIQYLAVNRATLIDRCAKVVHPDVSSHLDAWLTALPNEVQTAIQKRDPDEELLEIFISAGLLPKYAFPVDVVSLTIPSPGGPYRANDRNEEDAMQRDLKIALSEYAPGGEVIKGEFPKTYIYQSAGIYDPFEKSPDYRPTGILLECGDCQSVTLHKVVEPIPERCQECQSFNVMPLRYLLPPGFTVDSAKPNAGRTEYEGGGRERAGYATPARLHVGQSSFNAGQASTFAPRLYTLVREGDLFIANKGLDRNFPGFLICPTCGRAITEDTNGKHQYPANIPPQRGKNQGPRAGNWCPNQNDFEQMILGYPFHSEVILLGIDLPPGLDAPYVDPSGKAIWYSFGTLVANAAALVLQIDPSELKVGVRAVRRDAQRLHGEVFIYDDVPGGAGYARSIAQNLQLILEKALSTGERCENPECDGACYHCLYDYRNQSLHPLLDRQLGTALLRFLLRNQMPQLDPIRVQRGVDGLAEYAREIWETKPGSEVNGIHLSQILEHRKVKIQKAGLWVIHPLEARPTKDARKAIEAQTGLRCAIHNSFDLERRPFWVVNNLIRP